MTRFVRPSLAALHPYVPGEQPQGPGFVKLNTNENPYPPSPRVVEAVRAAAGADLRLYPDPTGTTLRRRAAEVYGVEPDRILVGNGSDELLSLLVRAVVEPGTRVAFPTPTYSLYETLVAIERGESVTIPYPDDFTLPDGLDRLGARLVFLCHPNSPSGVALPLDRIRSFAQATSALVVVDEAYVDFGGDTAIALLRECDNVVVLRTFSKSFSLAGMRIGLAFASRELIEDLMRIKDSYNEDRLSLVAAAAALGDCAWMRANVERVRATREHLTAELRARGFRVLDSAANFVLARRPGEDQAARYRALKDRRVLVRHFATPELSDALRITVGTDAEVETLLRALDEVDQGQREPAGRSRRRSEEEIA